MSSFIGLLRKLSQVVLINANIFSCGAVAQSVERSSTGPAATLPMRDVGKKHESAEVLGGRKILATPPAVAANISAMFGKM